MRTRSNFIVPKHCAALPHAAVVGITYSILLITSPAKGASVREDTLAAQRFEVGLTAGLALYNADPANHQDDTTKLYVGVAGTYALRNWFAVGAEIVWVDAFQNNSHDCFGCLSRGLLTLGLAELRLPLGTQHARLFGRFAAGPVFATDTYERQALLAAVRTSVGLDLRLWHLYTRPFVFLGTMTRTDPQLGLGLELGASF
jgi:hypothetical protein